MLFVLLWHVLSLLAAGPQPQLLASHMLQSPEAVLHRCHPPIWPAMGGSFLPRWDKPNRDLASTGLNVLSYIDDLGCVASSEHQAKQHFDHMYAIDD